MRFEPTTVAGVYVVELDLIEDDRGFFARSWCTREFEEHGLETQFVQANVGFNKLRGTLRGLHFQLPPHDEVKLVRCTRGAVWDVAVDLRKGSTTYLDWFGTRLDEENHSALYVPSGCAHGYLTLVDDSELHYQTSAFYAPTAATGLPYHDPSLAIEWPDEPRVISDQDRNWASLDLDAPPFAEAG